MDLKVGGWRVMNWIDVFQNRDKWGGTCEFGNEPGSIKCGEFLD